MRASTSTFCSLTRTIIGVLPPGPVRKRSVLPSRAPTESRSAVAGGDQRSHIQAMHHGRLSGVMGRSPAAHSASSYSPSAGSTAHASSSRSRRRTTGAVSRPCSYWVAPTTTPSARGTRYTCRPCTRARITRCGNGIQPLRHRSRSTSPFTGRTGRPGHNAGASMPLAITTASASTARQLVRRRCPRHPRGARTGRSTRPAPPGCPRPARWAPGSRAGCLAPAAVRHRGRPAPTPRGAPGRTTTPLRCAGRRHRRGRRPPPATRAP